jgi:hypothetical protein
VKIVECKKGTYDHSINFVDERDTYVGYDLSQSCCEHASWRIVSKAGRVVADGDEKLNLEQVNRELAPFKLDREFFEEGGGVDTSDGNWAKFRFYRKPECTYEDAELFLVLYNCHNGYYGHGFVVEHGGEQVHEGGL